MKLWNKFSVKSQENTAISGGRSKQPQNRPNTPQVLSDMYNSATQGKKLQTDAAVCGRSMVEMLGVLAIIGVLSVGAIAGYAKAMGKYKLNKQAELLDHLFYIMTQYKNEWHLGNYHVNLVPYYVKLGEIPESMTKGGYVYDAFNNKITLQTNGCPGDQPCSGTIIRYPIGKQENYDICHNIFKAAIAYAPHLAAFTYYNYDDEWSIAYPIHYTGDKYCSSSKKCIRDITMNDIYDVCHDCPQKNSCTFAFLWSFD